MITRDKKRFALLLDPDKLDFTSLQNRIKAINNSAVDLIFVGGSLISSDNMNMVMNELATQTHIPKILFPGNSIHIHPKADAILFLSLISGRNPEFLIGQHVISAPFLKNSGIKVLPTGYILIDGGKPTTVTYISNTMPIPADKPDVAAVTAMAGEMLGLQYIYMDAGSGARQAISTEMIKKVRENTEVPLIIGGGIRTVEQMEQAYSAGADVVVIGNAIEENPDFLSDAARMTENFNLIYA